MRVVVQHYVRSSALRPFRYSRFALSPEFIGDERICQRRSLAKFCVRARGRETERDPVTLSIRQDVDERVQFAAFADSYSLSSAALPLSILSSASQQLSLVDGVLCDLRIMYINNTCFSPRKQAATTAIVPPCHRAVLLCNSTALVEA